MFTRDEEVVPAAHTIYGRNFARIRSLEQFADTVGTLIQNQIRGFCPVRQTMLRLREAAENWLNIHAAFFLPPSVSRFLRHTSYILCTICEKIFIQTGSKLSLLYIDLHCDFRYTLSKSQESLK